MKNFLPLLIVFCSVTSYGAEYYDATVLFVDGKSKTGFVESPFGGKYIYYKATRDAEVEKLETSTVKGIIFRIDGETNEFHYVKVYLGWGQKRISQPKWLDVVEKGTVTLYVNRTTLSSGAHQNHTAGFLDYYCIREGEPAAKLIAQVSSLNNNQTFRAKAPLYFQDYPELAAKIKSKEYTWKDLVPVVQEYNKWAERK